jgi:transcriptional regulator with XRE-family HTH domain
VESNRVATLRIGLYDGAMDPVSKPGGPATGKDVAALAGVSAATVSRVLAGTRDVSPKLVRKVRAAARKLNVLAGISGFVTRG